MIRLLTNFLTGHICLMIIVLKLDFCHCLLNNHAEYPESVYI